MLVNTLTISPLSNFLLSSQYQYFHPHYPFFLPDDPAQYPQEYGKEFFDLLPPCTAPTCEFCRDSTHLESACPKQRYPVSPQELATYKGSHRTCRLCHLNGHGAFDCPWKEYGNNLILDQLKAMNGQPPSYPILPRPYTSEEINELQRRYLHYSFWITQDNVLVFKRAPAKVTLVDSDIASLGGCKVPLSIVNDLRNQDRTFTNEEWYQQHLIYGCWKLTCPYVAVNYHPLLNETDLDPNQPLCVTTLAAPCFNGQSPEEIRKWMYLYALRSSQESGLITAFTPASAIVKSLSRLTLLSTTIGSYPEWIPTTQTLIAFHHLFREKRRILKHFNFLPQFAGCNVFQREYYIDGKPLTGHKFHDLQAAIVRTKQQLSNYDPPVNVCMVINKPSSQQSSPPSSAKVCPKPLNSMAQCNSRLPSESNKTHGSSVNGCVVSDKSSSQQTSRPSNVIAHPRYLQSCTQRIPPQARLIKIMSSPNCYFHYEGRDTSHRKKPTCPVRNKKAFFLPLERRPITPTHWLNAENQQVSLHAPFQPTQNDIDLVTHHACKLPQEWITRQIQLLGIDPSSARTNEEWYALHCIRGCTYFNCGYVFYNYHPSIHNPVEYALVTRWDRNMFVDVMNVKDASTPRFEFWNHHIRSYCRCESYFRKQRSHPHLEDRLEFLRLPCRNETQKILIALTKAQNVWKSIGPNLEEANRSWYFTINPPCAFDSNGHQIPGHLITQCRQEIQQLINAKGPVFTRFLNAFPQIPLPLRRTLESNAQSTPDLSQIFIVEPESLNSNPNRRDITQIFHSVPDLVTEQAQSRCSQPTNDVSSQSRQFCAMLQHRTDEPLSQFDGNPRIDLNQWLQRFEQIYNVKFCRANGPPDKLDVLKGHHLRMHLAEPAQFS